MGLFWRPDPRDVLIAQLRAELSDLRSHHKQEREQWLRQAEELHQKMLALANPLALREVRRTPSGDSVAPASPAKPTYYPRSEHLVYPPYPATTLPPGPPDAGVDEES